MIQQDLHARLAVLSACQTGLGEIEDAGTVSLATAFHVAGIPRVVMSLWSVDDAATSALMRRFVAHVGEGDPARALQAAMLETAKDYPDPARWAAFVVWGSPLPLSRPAVVEEWQDGKQGPSPKPLPYQYLFFTADDGTRAVICPVDEGHDVCAGTFAAPRERMTFLPDAGTLWLVEAAGPALGWALLRGPAPQRSVTFAELAAGTSDHNWARGWAIEQGKHASEHAELAAGAGGGAVRVHRRRIERLGAAPAEPAIKFVVTEKGKGRPIAAGDVVHSGATLDVAVRVRIGPGAATARTCVSLYDAAAAARDGGGALLGKNYDGGNECPTIGSDNQIATVHFDEIVIGPPFGSERFAVVVSPTPLDDDPTIDSLAGHTARELVGEFTYTSAP